jgi:hypothetical protein
MEKKGLSSHKTIGLKETLAEIISKPSKPKEFDPFDLKSEKQRTIGGKPQDVKPQDRGIGIGR